MLLIFDYYMTSRPHIVHANHDVHGRPRQAVRPEKQAQAALKSAPEPTIEMMNELDLFDPNLMSEDTWRPDGVRVEKLKIY